MLKIFRNKNGQLFTGEYLVVLALAAAGILAMSVYFRRTVQSRIRDARAGMINVVREKAGAEYAGTLVWPEYEPYYVDRDVTTTQNLARTFSLQASPGNSSGIATSLYNDTIFSEFVSNTAAPAFAD